MGSLAKVIEREVEEWKAKQAALATTALRMPGGVFGHVMTTKVALQVMGD